MCQYTLKQSGHSSLVPESILSQPSTDRRHHTVRSKHWDQEDCPGWTHRTPASGICLLPLALGTLLSWPTTKFTQWHTLTGSPCKHLTVISFSLKLEKSNTFPLANIILYDFSASLLCTVPPPFFLVGYLPFLFCDGNYVGFNSILHLICFADKPQLGESHCLELGLVLYRTNCDVEMSLLTLFIVVTKYHA